MARIQGSGLTCKKVETAGGVPNLHPTGPTALAQPPAAFFSRVTGERRRRAYASLSVKPDDFLARAYAEIGGTTAGGVAYLVEGGAFATREDFGLEARMGWRW